MSDSPRLGRDVFLALAAVGWADGKLDPDEADAIVRTASDEGLELEEIEEIEAATKAPIDIGVIDRHNLSKEDRLFVYAVASWMTRLDGEVHEKEQEALRRLGEALKIPEKPREQADAIAREIAALPDGDRPLRYDLARLRATIGERLREAQRLRGEQPALRRLDLLRRRHVRVVRGDRRVLHRGLAARFLPRRLGLRRLFHRRLGRPRIALRRRRARLSDRRLRRLLRHRRQHGDATRACFAGGSVTMAV